MSQEVTLDGKLLKELRVAELKAACKVKNLPHSGNKAALIKRLKAVINSIFSSMVCLPYLLK